MIIPLERVIVSKAPQELLKGAWDGIMVRDYIPVFEPAVAILDVLPDKESVNTAIQSAGGVCKPGCRYAERTRIRSRLDPWYHEILESAKSDGAFYTENTSALMLARLAFSKDLVNWSDPEAVQNLRVIDPACGTGTFADGQLEDNQRQNERIPFQQ